jgi:hypothetical protein
MDDMDFEVVLLAFESVFTRTVHVHVIDFVYIWASPIEVDEFDTTHILSVTFQLESPKHVLQSLKSLEFLIFEFDLKLWVINAVILGINIYRRLPSEDPVRDVPVCTVTAIVEETRTILGGSKKHLQDKFFVFRDTNYV